MAHPRDGLYRARLFTGVQAMLLCSLVLLPPAKADDAAAGYAPRNLGTEIAYVGDAACGSCHRKQASTYPDTAMGRSFASVADLIRDGELKIPPGGVSFVHDKSATRYRVFMEEGSLRHEEVRIDGQGRDAFHDTRTVLFALGSGDRARTFLVKQDDRLYQSPIANRPRRDGWGMAAGYDMPSHSHFARPIPGECLFCHSNRASFVEGTLNTYGEPVFEGFAVGCERCHGPGELHVTERKSLPPSAEGIDPTIVNPARLTPDLRDSVCFQCHLQGDMRVVKADHPLYAFRPGLPLSDYFAVFHARKQAKFKVVGHVEALRESTCWKRSGGRVSCLTCHDPHRTPRGEEAAEQFRTACLTCHREEECGQEKMKEPRHAGIDPRDCVSCHMVKRPPSDAPHTLFTDHRISRVPAGEEPVEHDGDFVDLVNFLEGDRGDPRDLGLAYLMLAPYEHDVRYALRGAQILEEMVPREEWDVRALRTLANYYENTNRPQDTVAALETLVSRAPVKGEFKAALARMYLSMGRSERAASLARQAVEEDPHSAHAHSALASILTGAGRFDEAGMHYRAALDADPAHVLAHSGLADIEEARGRLTQAEAGYRKALVLDPESVDARFGLVRVRMARSDPIGAIRVLRDGIESAADPEQAAMMRYMVASILAMGGRGEEAIQELEVILAEFPTQPDALHLMKELRNRAPADSRP